MTEAIINNILQQSSNNFSSAQKEKTPQNQNNVKSFSETMQKINEQNKRSKKSNLKNDETITEADKEKTSLLSNQEFLAKLKEILSKNNKDVPSELLSLLQGGSLSKQQEAMLEQLMLNLKNNNLDISDLKALLTKNSDNQSLDNAQENHIFNSEENSDSIELKNMEVDDLKKLVKLLESDGENLSQAESSQLKEEINKLAKILINSNSETGKVEAQDLEQVLKTENLEDKLAELFSALKESDFSFDELTEIPEQKELKLPLLAKALDSESLDFSDLSDNFSSESNSSLFAELSAQIKEMLDEENTNLSNQKSGDKVELDNSDLFSLNNDSSLDFNFEGEELETKNQNNFFDLDNSDLFFSFEPEANNTNTNLNLENFSLNSDNTASLAENTDLRSQVVEQFRGEYSPETKEMQIQLKPESLGKVDISLSYDNEELTGRMIVESEVVRAQLENSLKGLKSDLLKQGINIEQFKIETAKNAPQQIEKQNDFAFNDQNAAFGDGETGQNQEYEQRRFFQGQYYVQRNNNSSSLNGDNLIMRQQEIINRAAFSNEKLNLLA